MTSQKIRVCLFGAGEMAEIHASNLYDDGRAELVAVVDPSTERASHISKRFGANIVSTDEAFALDNIDAYVISSPPKTHADYLERAAMTDAYIFCEKPIDDNIERVRICMDKLKGHETRVQMGFNRRFDAHFMELKAGLDAGVIGKPEQVLIISRDPQAPEPEGFIHSSGMLKETTIHDFDVVRWLLGEEPAEIYVMADALINPEFLKINQVDTATTTIRMKSGTQVTIINSLQAVFGYDQRLEVLGSTGQLQVGNLAKSLVIRSDVSGVTAEKPLYSYPQRYAQAYATEMVQFVDTVLAKGKCTPNAFDGLRASEMAEAALKSVREGQKVVM